MLLYLSQFLGFKVYSADGLLGKLYDIYFNDNDWAIKNIVIGKIFSYDQNKIVIPKIQVKAVRDEVRRIELNISKSTAINESNNCGDKPILHSDYVLSKIFGYPNLWSISDPADPEVGLLYSIDYTPNLRSIREVTGYGFRGFDKDNGYVSDFLIDLANWTIKYVVVKKINFFAASNKRIFTSSDIILDLKYPSAILAI